MTAAPRIISLLPGATEMVCALGYEKNLVGVSFDSDYPENVKKLPQVVTTLLPRGLTSLEIDKRVRAAKHSGISIFHTDQKLLEKLAPDIVLSQELCQVCAIGTSEFEKAARIINKEFKLISLEPHSVKNVMENILLIGSILGKQKEAKEVLKSLKGRISFIKNKTKSLNKPSVLIIEWIEPFMVAGHWVPEMVALARGKNMISKKGEISRNVLWEEIIASDPDILIIAPCGFDIKRTKEELGLIFDKKGFSTLKAAKSGQIYLVDGNAYLTRPGPRLINGIEIMAEIFHPKIFRTKYKNLGWEKAL